MNVSDAVVVVTGGARGIGYATAQRLVVDGARVAICDIDGAAARQAATRLGIGCHGQVDVSDSAQFAEFLERVAREVGPVDVLINNAGIMPVGRLHEEADVMTDRVVAVNLLGVVYGTKLALRHMLPRRHGHIINISSIAAETHVPGAATYCATKHAVSAFTESVRFEYRGSGLYFSHVLPTFTNTELIAGMARPPLLRNAEPAEVADTVVALIARPRPLARVTAVAGALSVTQKYLPRSVIEPLLRLTGGSTTFTSRMVPAARRAYTERITAP